MNKRTSGTGVIRTVEDRDLVERIKRIKRKLAEAAEDVRVEEGVTPPSISWEEQFKLAEKADCRRCFREAGGFLNVRMFLCPECGNKRCPKATDHRLDCTNSNEPGQEGSDY